MSTAKQSILTMIYKGALSGLSFISSVLVARYLTPGPRLAFQFAGTLVQAGLTFVGGFTSYYAFAIARRPETRRQSVQMGNLFVGVSAIAIWIALALLSFTPWPWFHPSSPWFWGIVCTPLAFLFGYATRMLQARNEMSWLNRANTAQPVLFIVAMIPFVLWQLLDPHARLRTAYLLWTLSYVMAAAITLIVGYRKLQEPGSLRWRHWREEWKGTVSYGGWSSIGQIVNYVNYRVDFWWIIAYLGTSSKSAVVEASAYGIAVTASEVLVNVSGSLLQVVFTRMTSSNRKEATLVTEASSRQTLLTSAIVAVVMYLVFPWLIPFAFGHTYDVGLIPFYILLPGLIFRATSNIIIQFATNTLAQPKSAIWMNGLSALINTLFCITLIPVWGAAGAATASTASYAISFVIYVIWFARVTGTSGRALWIIRKADWLAYARLFRRLQRAA